MITLQSIYHGNILHAKCYLLPYLECLIEKWYYRYLRQQFLHWGASLSSIVICVIIFKYYQSVSLAKLDFNIKTISKRFH